MSPSITKALKTDSKLRMAIIGPAGSGKTYTSLKIASELGKKICLIDSEHGSSQKYADIFEFDVIVLEDDFSPTTYTAAIKMIEDNKYDVCIIDGLSQAWAGKYGALEQVDLAAQKMQSGGKFAGWRSVTPMHNKMLDTILAAKMHVITTMRSKTEYLIDEDERGRMSVKKIGTAPVQRQGIEYEFDIVGDMNQDNKYIISKSRCPELSGGMFDKPGSDLADIIKQWLKGKKVKEIKEVKEIKQATVEYVPETTFKQIWDNAKKTGYTTQLSKLVFKDLGIASWKEIPVSKMDDLIEILTSETELQKYMERLNDFNRRGAETNVPVS